MARAPITIFPSSTQQGRQKTMMTLQIGRKQATGQEQTWTKPLDFGNLRSQIKHLAEIFRDTPLYEVAK